jgi:ABC-type dipeptide/oligopeptide/nickel transport system ATPase component
MMSFSFNEERSEERVVENSINGFSNNRDCVFNDSDNNNNNNSNKNIITADNSCSGCYKRRRKNGLFNSNNNDVLRRITFERLKVILKPPSEILYPVYRVGDNVLEKGKEQGIS